MARSKPSTPRTRKQDASSLSKNGKHSSPKKRPEPILLENEEPTHLRQFSGVLDTRDLLHVLTQVKNGNFSVRLPIDQVGISGKICDTLNEIISLNEKMM